MDEGESISITVCGDGGTGKSSITLRLVRSQWTNEYDPTIEDSYSVTRILDGNTYTLNLTDTAGQEEYRGLFGAAQVTSADAFLLVYDITSMTTLYALDHFNSLIDMETERRIDLGGVPPIKIVAGNKCDLRLSREVNAQTALDWARRHDCMFMETSARDMVNVEETFALLVRKVAKVRRERISNPPQANAAKRLPPVPSRAAEKSEPLSDFAPYDQQSDRSVKSFLSKLKCW